MSGKISAAIAVTGANGFIGRALVAELLRRKHSVVSLVRQRSLHNLPCQREIVDLVRPKELELALSGVGCVIHLAGRAHMVSRRGEDDLEAYRAVNYLGTMALAKAAVNAGVGMMIFLSTIGVHGFRTINAPFSILDVPAPYDEYTRTKLEAEQGLEKFSDRGDLDVCIVRAPLVYGPNPVGNMIRLLNLLDAGVPLPFANVSNRRSMISVFNLVDLLASCVTHRRARGKTFLASDNDDVSLPQLIEMIAEARHQRVRMFPVPKLLLTAAFHAIGRSQDLLRLTSSLEVDIAFTMKELEWVPPLSAREGMHRSFSPRSH